MFKQEEHTSVTPITARTGRRPGSHRALEPKPSFICRLRRLAPAEACFLSLRTARLTPTVSEDGFAECLRGTWWIRHSHKPRN